MKFYRLHTFLLAGTRMFKIVPSIPLALLLILSFFAPWWSILASPRTVTLQGEIVNGSLGIRTGADAVYLEKLTQHGTGAPLKVIKKPGPVFRFEGVPFPGETLIISVLYRGNSYYRMLSPNDPGLLNPQRIFVFDDGGDPRKVRLTAMDSLTKTSKGIAVERFFVIMNGNSPARNVATKDLRFVLPANAKNARAIMKLEDTNLSLPLTVRQDDSGYAIDRPLRPGNSTLSIRYEVDGYKLEETTPDVIALNGKLPISHGFQFIAWKPEDARPSVQGAETKEVTVPGFGKVIQAVYKMGTTIRYDMSSGSFYYENLLMADYNPLYEYPLIVAFPGAHSTDGQISPAPVVLIQFLLLLTMGVVLLFILFVGVKKENIRSLLGRLK